MVLDHTAVWDNCLQTIKQNVKPRSFQTWFDPIKPVAIDNHSLTIQVPNRFFYEWLEEHYVGLLKMSLRKVLGEKARLEYQILSNAVSEIAPKGISQTNNHNSNKDYNPGSVDTSNIKNPFVIPGIRKVKVEPRLIAEYTFDNFIEGDCNRLARSAGIAVAKSPGSTSFNPLFLYGNVGLGKTHLAHAIGNSVIENNPNLNVLYVSSEKFTNQIIQAIKNNAVNDLVNYYQLMDVLIVDDIQFLRNKQKTQEIFFHVFNQLHLNKKQLIFTSDRAPIDLNGMEERLISRFKWGLSADLQAPDLETRMAILESKMSEEGVELPQDVIEFISYNIQNNIRELEGVLISLIAQSSLNQRAIDLDLAKNVIKSFVKNLNKEITVEFIQELVAEYFSLDVEKLQGKTRKRQVVIARQLSMYLTKQMTDKSLKAIGNDFGGRDHSTVIHSCKTIQDLMETDGVFKDTVDELEKKIRMSLNDA